jgi:hypothetical protein
VAGKTGTKDRVNKDGSGDIVSAWFVAYTKQISTAVMYVAGDGGNGDLDKFRRPGDSTFFGGTYPALTWVEYMKVATEGQAVKQFDSPAYVNRDKAAAQAPTHTSKPSETQKPTETTKPTETQAPTQEPTQTPTQKPTKKPKPTPTETATATTTTTRWSGWHRAHQAAQRQGLIGVGVLPAEAELTDPPSRTDAFVRTLSQDLGGPIGRYAAAGGGWWSRLESPCSSAPSAISRVSSSGCLPDDRRRAATNWYKHMCYSASVALSRPWLASGQRPISGLRRLPGAGVPPLTGWFLDLSDGWRACSAPRVSASPRNSPSTRPDLLRRQPGTAGRPVPGGDSCSGPHGVGPAMGRDDVGRACVAVAALINWDLLAVALTALGCLAWAAATAARRDAAGVGHGREAPGLLLGPLFLLCLRSRRMVQFWTMFSIFLASWLAVNLPVMILARAGGLWSTTRPGGDFGSLWYVFVLAGHPVPQLNLLTMTIFALACLGIALLIILAPRRPRFGAMAFLVVAAFLITNKVYSPQYVLWLLPLLILARPRWREILIFSTAELIYFGSIWFHLGGFLTPGNSGQDRLYWLAVLIRLGVQCWLVILVVRDALRRTRIRYG